MFSTQSFDNYNIPENLKPTLAAMSNASIAQSTWSTYRTSLNKLRQFSQDTQIQTNLPLPNEVGLAFVAWLLDSGLSAATVDSYISGIKQVHLAAGLNPPDLRTPLVSTVIKGKRNLDNNDKRAGNKTTRIPITPNMLRYLKTFLKKSEHSSHDKNLLWATVTTCFSGGLRCGEILCKKKHKYDPDTDMLNKYLKITTLSDTSEIEIVQLTLRSEKQNQSGTPTVLDIYPSSSSLCPVRSVKKWRQSVTDTPDSLPAFRWEDGSNLTARELNRFLKSALQPFLAGTNKTVSGHSLRIGLTSCLGSLGFSEEEIMSAGRWSSRAYKSYLQLPRTRRLEMARAIAKL